MGWLWSSQPTVAEASTPTFNETQPSSANEARPDVAREQSSRLPPPSRDELAAEELRQFLAEISAETDGSVDSKSKDKHVLPSNRAKSESMYPDTMSCRQALDHAYYCQSVGGQFMNVYRYGGIRNCSEQWSDFWFCMRSKSYSDEQRKEMIRQHYRAKEAKYKVAPSSEDIWRARSEPLRTAFNEDPDTAAATTNIP